MSQSYPYVNINPKKAIKQKKKMKKSHNIVTDNIKSSQT